MVTTRQTLVHFTTLPGEETTGDRGKREVKA
jgi:hypothetical protein